MNNTNSPTDRKNLFGHVIQILLQVGVLVFIFGWCFKILSPFILPVMWGVVISITAYPLFLKLKTKLGHRGMLASVLITGAFLLVLIIPTILLSESLIDGVKEFTLVINEGQNLIPPPGDRARSLPSFAKPLVDVWQDASENLQAVVVRYNEQFRTAGKFILSLIANTGIGIIYFLISIIIAGVFLAYSKEGGSTLRTIFIKLAGKKGEELVAVSEATIRSVVKGILGVAFIQTFLAGIGFVIAGVPAAGLWTFFCLIFAIIQIGVGPVVIPVIIYLFYTADLTTAIIFLIWGIIIMVSDNILKPLLLGRGAPVPMLVVFLGSIGGFIATGFLGLFLGAVILSLGYKLFDYWIKEEKIVAENSPAEKTESELP